MSCVSALADVYLCRCPVVCLLSVSVVSSCDATRESRAGEVHNIQNSLTSRHYSRQRRKSQTNKSCGLFVGSGSGYNTHAIRHASCCRYSHAFAFFIFWLSGTSSSSDESSTGGFLLLAAGLGASFLATAAFFAAGLGASNSSCAGETRRAGG